MALGQVIERMTHGNDRETEKPNENKDVKSVKRKQTIGEYGNDERTGTEIWL